MASELNAEAVLDFWLGSPDQLEAKRKTLWFASGEARDAVDEVVTERFGVLVQQAEAGSLCDTWAGDYTDARKVLALVIVLDQLARHVFRVQQERVEVCLKLATQHCTAALEHGLDSHLLPAHVCFLVMPLRHAAQVASCSSSEKRHLFDVLENVLVRLDTSQRAHATVVDRFQAATDRRSVFSTRDLETELKYLPSDLLDDNCLKYDCTTAKLDLFREPLLDTLVSFLRENVDTSAERLDLYVSLSGGVDSMVIARLLAYIAETDLLQSPEPSKARSLNETFRRKAKKPRHGTKPMTPCDCPQHGKAQHSVEGKKGNTFVHAIHINYRNRPESTAEAEYVEEWCKALGINFVLHTIEDISRSSTPRDEYEKLSREIRFKCYQKAMETFTRGGVMLGHHRGDIQENVLSNVCKGGSILQLAGMAKESVVEKVQLWRPFLDHDKSDILNFAHEHNVPYFKDTTPKWSTRAKLRDRLLPTLAMVYGSGYTKNLSHFAAQSTELNEMLSNLVFQPFWDRVRFGAVATSIPLEGYMDHPAFFWRFALRHICHQMSTGAIKDRAAFILTEALNSRRITPKTASSVLWLALKQSQPTFISSTRNELVLFREDKFISPDRSKDVWKEGESLIVGPFQVKVSEFLGELDTTGQKFDEASFLEHGSFSYMLFASMDGRYQLCPEYGRGIDYFHKIDRKLRTMFPIVRTPENVDLTRKVQVSVFLIDP